MSCAALGVQSCCRSNSPSTRYDRIDLVAPEKAANLASVSIRDVPHVIQKEDFGAEATAEMGLRALGGAMDQDQIFALAGVDPRLGRGASPAEVHEALKTLGCEVGALYRTVREENASANLAELFREIHGDLLAGYPSMLRVRRDDTSTSEVRWVLVLGYEHETDSIVYSDASAAGKSYVPEKLAVFLSRSLTKGEHDEWRVVRIRIAGRPIFPGPLHSGGVPPAHYARQVHAIRSSESPSSTVLIEAPFVIVSDQNEQQALQTAGSVVRWAVALLRKDFFARDPEQLVTLWLYSSVSAYERAIRERFPNAPSTPFGFYSTEYQAVVVNLATGGGTLVHEIVHPFLAANVPDCPVWLNEGLGSLFEQSVERDGRIVGTTNWRLDGLQRAIQNKSTVSLSKLMRASRVEFHGEDPPLYYAQARYLLYFLQEHGVLGKFWERYSERRERDPSGEATLLDVVGARDLRSFQQRWESDVMTYRFE